jgi:hypothetical protein
VPIKNQFSLVTLLLIMDLAAVILGTLLIAPGLGITLIVFAVPALVRAVMAGRQRLARGETLTTTSKIVDFVTSVAIVWAISIAASIAFAVTCTAAVLPAALRSPSGPAFLEGNSIIFGAGFGLVCGAIVATWLFWITRPKTHVSALGEEIR